MAPLQLLAGIIGISANVPLFLGIVHSRIEQSFAAFMLWALLDTIAAVTTIFQHGNYMLPLGYSFTASAIAIALVVKKQLRWSYVETLTSFLVLICLAIWFFVGDEAGTIASSLAVIIAGIPQAVEIYKKPQSLPFWVYLAYLVAAILSFLGGKTWTVEERFYSGSVIFLTLGIILISFRKVPQPIPSAH